MTKEKVALGKVKKDYKDSTIANKYLYIDKHSWDCGWYWGFGYLGNKNCHYHVDGLKKIEKYMQSHFSYKVPEWSIKSDCI